MKLPAGDGFDGLLELDKTRRTGHCRAQTDITGKGREWFVWAMLPAQHGGVGSSGSLFRIVFYRLVSRECRAITIVKEAATVITIIKRATIVVTMNFQSPPANEVTEAKVEPLTDEPTAEERVEQPILSSLPPTPTFFQDEVRNIESKGPQVPPKEEDVDDILDNIQMDSKRPRRATVNMASYDVTKKGSMWNNKAVVIDIRQLHGLDDGTGRIYRLSKAQYGLRSSPKWWYDTG